MNKITRILISLILSVSIIVGVTACKPATSNESSKSDSLSSSNGNSSLSGKILITGSTSFLDLMGALGEAFTEKNPDVTVDVQAGGSGVGIKDTMNKLNDVGMSSRELKTDGTEDGLNEYVLAIEALAVVVNSQNSVKNLTKDQIVAIFKGEITNWKEVGGTEAAITVFNREASSGTRGAFGELLKLEKSGKDGYNYFTKAAVTQDSTGKILAGVAADKNAIGYIGLGSVDETVHAVSIDSKEPTLDNIKSGSYALKRPFLLLTNKSAEKELAKALIDFSISDEGEAIVSEMKLIKPSELK